MIFGINTLLFESPFKNNSTRFFKEFKAWGFDAVEIAVEDPKNFDPVYVRRKLDENNLKCCAICSILGSDRDLRGDAAQQKNAMEYLSKIIDYCETLNSPMVVGPLYSCVGRADGYSGRERQLQWWTAVKNLRNLAKYAEKRNVILAIEPLNRFETDMINTCAQALQLIHDIKSPVVKIHLDTFHMNIEEKDPALAILKAGKNLAHFHASGNDRGTPGNDHINWASIAASLKKIKYNGAIVIESFTPGIEIIAKAASIWRAIEPDAKHIAKNGLKFLRRILS